MGGLLTDEKSSRVELFHCCWTVVTVGGRSEMSSDERVLVKGLRFDAIDSTSCKLS